MRWLITKIVVSIPAVLLAMLLIGLVRQSRTHYWLTTDGNRGTAIVTAKHAHGVVDYKYTAFDNQYVGTSQRNWEFEKFRNVDVGDESIVFYSSSRPWLSSLETPSFPIRAWPMFFFTGIGEIIAIIYAAKYKPE